MTTGLALQRGAEVASEVQETRNVLMSVMVITRVVSLRAAIIPGVKT